MAGFFDFYDPEKSVQDTTQTYTPYGSGLGGLLARKWDSAFMSDEQIKAQNADYYRARYGQEGNAILNNPTTPAGVQSFDKTTGGVLELKPSDFANGPPQQLANAYSQTVPAQYSQQQLGDLARIPGYAERSRQLATEQHADATVRQAQGWSVNPASNAAQEMNMNLRKEREDLRAKAEAERIARGHLGVSQGNLSLAQSQFDYTKRNNAQDVNAIYGNGPFGPTPSGAPMPAPQAATPQTAMHLQDAAFKRAELARQQQFPAFGLIGKDAIEYQGNVAKMESGASIANDVVDYLSKVGVGGKALDRGEVNAMSSAYQQHIVPAMATMVGTGTIQKGDMEFIEQVMGDPGAWTSLDARQIKKVKQILTSVDDERKRLYGLAGREAPAIKQSAWARSRSTVNQPTDIKWGP